MRREPCQISRQNTAGIRTKAKLIQGVRERVQAPGRGQEFAESEGIVNGALMAVHPRLEILRGHDVTPARGVQYAPAGTGIVTPRVEAMSLSNPTRPYGPA